MTWSPNVAVSNPFNPFEGYPNQQNRGDYITIVSDNTWAVMWLTPLPLTSIAQRKPARRRRLLRSGIPWVDNTHSDSNANRVTVCNTNADKHTHPHSNTTAYSYPNGYSNSHSYSTANTHAEECSDAERASDSAAEAVRRVVICDGVETRTGMCLRSWNVRWASRSFALRHPTIPLLILLPKALRR